MQFAPPAKGVGVVLFFDNRVEREQVHGKHVFDQSLPRRGCCQVVGPGRLEESKVGVVACVCDFILGAVLTGNQELDVMVENCRLDQNQPAQGGLFVGSRRRASDPARAVVAGVQRAQPFNHLDLDVGELVITPGGHHFASGHEKRARLREDLLSLEVRLNLQHQVEDKRFHLAQLWMAWELAVDEALQDFEILDSVDVANRLIVNEL